MTDSLPKNGNHTYRFATPERWVVLTEEQMEECRMWMNESGVPPADHMRYMRDTAARYGDPLIYLRRWGEYFRLESVRSKSVG